jgi:hypothetical protein
VADIASADAAQDKARLFDAETGNLAVRYLTAVGDADAAFAEAAYVRTANPSRKRPNPEPRDRPPIRKSPPLAGISGVPRGKISAGQTAWLATQC